MWESLNGGEDPTDDQAIDRTAADGTAAGDRDDPADAATRR